MRAEKKSRWRADVATPLARHTLSEGVFPLRCLAIAFGCVIEVLDSTSSLQQSYDGG
jgi:hypothetical protein